MARMIFFLLSIPAAVGGSLVTATLSVNNSVAATNMSLLTDELPNCVNGSQFAEWGGGMVPISCDNAVRGLRSVIEGNRRLFMDFVFYSKLAPPRRMPAQGWPLPQGAVSGWCQITICESCSRYLLTPTGNCAFTIRMARDFEADSLPTRSGGYHPPNRGPIQKLSTWSHILRVVDPLYNGCTLKADGPEAGWSIVSDGIVVSFWPRNSAMNEMYGPDLPLSIESPNITDILSD